jgi:peptidoglycan/LPS O-acetylase OafA/YrhL
MRNLVNSKWFLADYICGLLIAANFLGMTAIARGFAKMPRALLTGIRWASSFTLSLYLFHTPLLLFFNAIMPGEPTGPLRIASILLACLGSTVALGYFTERNRKAFEQCVVAPAVRFVVRITQTGSAPKGGARRASPGD